MLRPSREHIRVAEGPIGPLFVQHIKGSKVLIRFSERGVTVTWLQRRDFILDTEAIKGFHQLLSRSEVKLEQSVSFYRKILPTHEPHHHHWESWETFSDLLPAEEEHQSVRSVSSRLFREAGSGGTQTNQRSSSTLKVVTAELVMCTENEIRFHILNRFLSLVELLWFVF